MHRFFIVEADAQRSFSMLPVVVDTDILDIDSLNCQNRGNDGDGTGFIHHIYGEGILRSDGALDCLGKGVR